MVVTSPPALVSHYTIGLTTLTLSLSNTAETLHTWSISVHLASFHTPKPKIEPAHRRLLKITENFLSKKGAFRIVLRASVYFTRSTCLFRAAFLGAASFSKIVQGRKSEVVKFNIPKWPGSWDQFDERHFLVRCEFQPLTRDDPAQPFFILFPKWKHSLRSWNISVSLDSFTILRNFK